jgi:site-specific DNA recombinase
VKQPGKTVVAGSYCRLSLASMEDTTKVDDQDVINHRTAEIRGWVIPPEHVYKDNSRSAWKRDRNRPRWDAMLQAIARGDIQAVVVYHGDRLIRQPYDLELLLNIARERGVRLASPTGERDLDNPDDQFILRIEAAQACRESDNTSRRMKNGNRRRREQGLVRRGGRGGRAFGFQTDGVTHIDAERDAIREAAHRVLAGEHVSVIARDLNERGFRTPTGGLFSHGTIKKMLLRPRYAGLMPDGENAAAWQPVHDEDRDKAREIWESLTAVLEHRAAAFDYVSNARRYLLSGIAACGSCGEPVAIRHNTRGATLLGYGCVNPACEKKVHRKAAHVDLYIEGGVLQLLADDGFIAGLTVGGDSGVAAEIAALQVRKAEAEKQLASLADHPNLKPDLLLASLASFDTRIGELRARIALSARRRLLVEHAGLSRQEWEGLPLETRRALVAASFRVTIAPTGRRGPGFDPDGVDLQPIEDD